MDKKILVVEDEENTIKVLTSRLESAGYDVEIAIDGKQAIDFYIESLNKEPYSLMLIDIMIPKISGIDVVKYIRNKEKEDGIASKHNMPIIVISGFRQVFLEELGNMDIDHIIKPFNSSELLDKIKEKIGRPLSA